MGGIEPDWRASQGLLSLMGVQPGATPEQWQQTLTDGFARDIGNRQAAAMAWSLTQWVHQLRSMVWVSLGATLALVLMSGTYVWSVHRGMVVVAGVGTVLCVVLAGAIVVSLERDPVLSHLGGTTPGRVSVAGIARTSLEWGVLPLALAFTAYDPTAFRWLADLAAGGLSGAR